MTLSSLPSLAFPYQLDALTLTGGTAGDSCSLTVSLAGEAVLTTTLTLDAAGEAELCDLGRLVMSYLSSAPSVLSISVDGTAVGQSVVIPCRCIPARSAKEWIAARPLSLLAPEGEKTTSWKSAEHLSFILPSTAQLASSLSLYFADGSTAVTSLTAVAGDEVGDFKLWRLEWEWRELRSVIPLEHRSAFHAVLTVSGLTGGAAVVRYFAIERPYGAEEVEFLNAFSQRETLLFSSVTAKHKPSYSAATIGRAYRNYLIENGTTWEAVSLALSDAELDLAADFTEASELVRLSDGAELTLTEGELEVSSTPDALPRLKVTWRERLALPRRGRGATRIFDDSFDATYN